MDSTQSLLYPDYFVQACIEDATKDLDLYPELQELLNDIPNISTQTHKINTNIIPQIHYPFPSFDNPPLFYIPDNVKNYMQQQQQIEQPILQNIVSQPQIPMLIPEKPMKKMKKKKRPYKRESSKLESSYHYFIYTLFQTCNNPIYQNIIKINQNGGFTIIDTKFCNAFLCRKIWKIPSSRFYKILELHSFHQIIRKSNQMVYFHPSFKPEILHSLSPPDFKRFF